MECITAHVYEKGINVLELSLECVTGQVHEKGLNLLSFLWNVLPHMYLSKGSFILPKRPSLGVYACRSLFNLLILGKIARCSGDSRKMSRDDRATKYKWALNVLRFLLGFIMRCELQLSCMYENWSYWKRNRSITREKVTLSAPYIVSSWSRFNLHDLN